MKTSHARLALCALTMALGFNSAGFAESASHGAEGGNKAGAIVSPMVDAGSSTTLDFADSNVIRTSASCGDFTLKNFRSGGVYMLIVAGATGGKASFKHLGLSLRTTGPLSCQPGTLTTFTFLRAGNDILAAEVPGFK